MRNGMPFGCLPMPISYGPGFPAINEDSEILDGLGKIPVRPIFIMGLHRLGSTFLYGCIAKSFPLAQLSLYHLFYCRRLLIFNRDGSARCDWETLNNYFRARETELQNGAQ